MTDTSPFDHRPDPELGATLRAALETTDDEAFAQRVIEAADPYLGSRRSEWWEVLVRWAQPELAAASVAALVGAVIWFSVTSEPGSAQSALGDPLRSAEEQVGVPALFADAPAPDVDELLAVALGN